MTPVSTATPMSAITSPVTATVRKHYPNWRVIVHNTFEHVTSCLVRIIPQMTPDGAWAMADRIHNDGAATVWSGPLEQAEMYHKQLGGKNLTMSTLESE